MKDSDNTKSRFKDMQQHPGNYSDKEIEDIIAELDEPADVEAEWNNFINRNIAPDEVRPVAAKPAKRIAMHWLRSIAAIAVIALGVWGMKTFTYQENTSLQPAPQLADKPQSNQIATNEKTIAKNTPPEKKIPATQSVIADEPSPIDEKPSPSSNILIRGTNNTLPDKSPVIIVNGLRIQDIDALAVFNTDDIDSIRIYKDENAKARYEARFGSQVKDGIIDVTLKAGREDAYADVLNPKSDSEKIFSSVEKFPEFPGGQDSLRTYIKENLKYPAEFPDTTITGRVIINFVVKSDGSVGDFKLMRSLLKNADKTACTDSAIINIFAEEALRVCRQMPHWTPGGMYTNEGFKYLNVRFTLPVIFGKNKVEQKKGIKIR